MSELICTCHCGGTMFYRHLHASDCPCATQGDEAPESHPDTIATLRATITQQAQEIVRLEGVCKERLEQGQQLHDQLRQLHDQLAAMTTERDAARGRIQIADKRATLHPSWHEKDKPALLDALAFQGGMTKVLLDETDELRQQLAASQQEIKRLKE